MSLPGYRTFETFNFTEKSDCRKKIITYCGSNLA